MLIIIVEKEMYSISVSYIHCVEELYIHIHIYNVYTQVLHCKL